jgi:hypothetical protein
MRGATQSQVQVKEPENIYTRDCKEAASVPGQTSERLHFLYTVPYFLILSVDMVLMAQSIQSLRKQSHPAQRSVFKKRISLKNILCQVCVAQ